MEKAPPPAPCEPLLWSTIDSASDRAQYFRYLSAYASLETAKTIKERALGKLGLQEDSHVLDAGCGLGDDTRAMARLATRGRAVGLDASKILTEEARRRCSERSGEPPSSAEFVTADIYKIPFEDAIFDSCLADGVFQHLQDPSGALKELLRVTKGGGTIVLVDPDWTSLHVSCSVCYGPIQDRNQTPLLLDISRRILLAAPLQGVVVSAGPLWYRLCRDTKVLVKARGVVKTVGLKAVKSETMVLTTHSLENADLLFNLKALAVRAVDRQLVSADEASCWVEDLRRCDSAGLFRASVLVVIVSGQKDEQIE